MAQLGQTFDAHAVEPSAPRDLLPPGDYKMEIVRSEMRETSKGGQMLELELAVTDGQYKGQRAYERLNLVNSNATAQQIAHQTLSAICRATGQMQVSDSEQLHFKPMSVKVAVKAAQGEYGPSNVVKGYTAIGGSRAPSGVGGGQTSAASTQAAVGPATMAKAAPWRKAV